MPIMVKKESGEAEEYSQAKVERAILRSGMGGQVADEIVAELKPRLYDGITTREIYSVLSKIIAKRKPEAAHKFSLKRALTDLGPEGHEFEDFAAKLLSFYGYDTLTRQTIWGKCVTHEIDVVASKGAETYAMECKFHNSGGVKCRIQVALYTYARYLDLAAGQNAAKGRKFTSAYLICNTKFSEDVITYAGCMKMPLLGWHYPINNGLETMIENKKCWPITALNMPRQVSFTLMKRGIIVVQDLPETAEKLAAMSGISLSNAKAVIGKAEYAR